MKNKYYEYVIYFTDNKTGATSPIDNVVTETKYTPEEYIKDCKDNAEDDWNNMLANGIVTMEVIQ